jgi:hypothetical protein
LIEHGCANQDPPEETAPRGCLDDKPCGVTDTSAKLTIGRVYAPDEQIAIAKAIKEFGIKYAEQRRRLVAQ